LTVEVIHFLDFNMCIHFPNTLLLIHKTLKSDFKHNPAISVAHATFPRPLLNVTNATSQSTS